MNPRPDRNHIFEAQMKRDGKLPAGLKWAVIVGACFRILFYLIADNNGGDAIARAFETQNWMRHPSFTSPVPQWGPVYFYITGSLGFLLKDAELATRLLSMVCGIATIAIVFRLTRILGGDGAATISSFICALSGLHIGYSTTSSSEMSYLFFILLGLTGFFQHQSSGRLWPLLGGGLCFAIGTGIRYEGWIFFPFLCLLLFWPSAKLFDRESLLSEKGKALILFGLVAGLWIIVWSIFCWTRWGDPLYAVHVNQFEIHEFAPESIRPLPYRLALPVGVLLLSLSPLPFVGMLYAILKFWKRPPLVRQFIFVSVAFAAVQYLQIWRAATVSNARYTLTLFMLSSVLAGLGISEFCDSLLESSAKKFKATALAVMVLTQVGVLAGSESRLPFNEKLNSVSPRLRYPHYLSDAARALRPRVERGDSLILDTYNWEDNVFGHALRLPLDQQGRVFTVWTGDSHKLDEFLQARHPRFLVYSDKGKLRTFLDLPEQCAQNVPARGVRLNCFYSNEIYRLYEIRY